MSFSLAKTTLIGSWFNNKVVGYGSVNSIQELEGKIIVSKFYMGIDIYMINDTSSRAVEIVLKYMNVDGDVDSEKCLACYDKCKKKFVFNINSPTNIIFKDDVVDVEFFYNGELRIISNGDLDIKMNTNTLNSVIKGTVNDTLKKEPKCF